VGGEESDFHEVGIFVYEEGNAFPAVELTFFVEFVDFQLPSAELNFVGKMLQLTEKVLGMVFTLAVTEVVFEIGLKDQFQLSIVNDQ